MLTASEMKLILTPTLKIAANDKVRAHVWETAAQRISGYTEPSYYSDDMLRGHEDEVYARRLYAQHYAPVTECGFITNDRLGFMLGCSPDGLVGDDGLIEAKSRRQKFQIEAWATGEVHDDFILQLQGLLFITERKWIDFLSYSGGLPMWVSRVFPHPDIQSAIEEAATLFERAVAEKVAAYEAALAKADRIIETERTEEQEMVI
jgi:YqaJ-like viral recombinase domain